MAANPDDPHFSVGMDDALAGTPRYQFQDAVNQARYDRGYAHGELILIDRDWQEKRQRAVAFQTRQSLGVQRWQSTIEEFERRMRARGLIRG